MILLLCGHDLDALVFHLLATFGVFLARYGVEVALYLLIFVQINRDQACKLKVKLREFISCFCCIQISHAVLKADSQGSSGT